MLEEGEEENFLQFSALPVAGATDKGGFEGEAQFFNLSPTFLTQPDSCQLEVVVLIFCSF